MSHSSSLAKDLTGNPMQILSPQQKIFVDALLRGQTQTMAARLAGYGYPHVEGHKQMKSPRVRDALRYQQKKHEKAAMMTRKKVMDGMLEAIEMAKLQADPGVMVNGWREIGRMCGYYAAEKKVIDINITAKRTVDKLESLTDAELLELIAADSDAIEGECTEVLEATQEAADAEYGE
jgi:phage terminase small subunit